MKHLGDISKIHGAHIEPVDLITFGSPCQDLSVAGKRAGLKHEVNGDEETTRSGLFMEAVRIIKEMREATDGKYPRFALWENVPGAFSSNKGEDFRIVLEEIAKISEKDAVMPEVPKGGWAYADCFSGDGWSMAYRVFDAQHWGVPQRRRRIHLVADFAGECAEEVLFEREGLRGDFAPGRAPRQGTAADAESSTGAEGSEGEGYGLSTYENYPADSRVKLVETAAPTLTAKYTKLGSDDAIVCMATQQGGAEVRTDSKAPTITAAAGMSGNNQPVIAFTQNQRDEVRNLGDVAGALRAEPGMKQQTFIIDSITGDKSSVAKSAGFKAGQGIKARGIGWGEEQSPTLASEAGGNSIPSVAYTLKPVTYNGVAITSPKNSANPKPGEPCHTLGTDSRNYTVYCMAHGQGRAEIEKEKSPCLTCNHEQPIIFDKEVYNSGVNATGGHYIAEDGPAPTLRASVPPGVSVPFPKKITLAAGTHGMASHLTKTEIEDGRGYIVRRLTPIECARLQGFADNWGQIDKKESFSEEEYRFWHDVRNTHAAINGKQVKDYTEEQMLSWYNKLHTDSAEYKMWGNGIALPPALYVMQGIADVLETAPA